MAVWDTPGFTKKLSAQQLAEKRLSEIKNGRLAMIGMVRSTSHPHPPTPTPTPSPALGLPRPAAFAPPSAAFRPSLPRLPSPCRALHTLARNPTQASICFSMAIPGSVPLLRDAPALTGAPFALPFGSF